MAVIELDQMPRCQMQQKLGDVGENATCQTSLGQILKYKKGGRIISFFVTMEFVNVETINRSGQTVTSMERGELECYACSVRMSSISEEIEEDDRKVPPWREKTDRTV